MEGTGGMKREGDSEGGKRRGKRSKSRNVRWGAEEEEKGKKRRRGRRGEGEEGKTGRRGEGEGGEKG